MFLKIAHILILPCVNSIVKKQQPPPPLTRFLVNLIFLITGPVRMKADFYCVSNKIHTHTHSHTLTHTHTYTQCFFYIAGNKQLLHVSKEYFTKDFSLWFFFLFIFPSALLPLRLSHDAYWERKRLFPTQQWSPQSRETSGHQKQQLQERKEDRLNSSENLNLLLPLPSGLNLERRKS